MAIFYHPNRSAPTTTLTIASLESYGSDRIEDPQQSMDDLAGGGVAVYDLGGTIEYIPIKIRNLPAADKTSLHTFIVTSCNYMVETFDFTDDQGNEYNGCQFDFSSSPLKHSQVSTNLFNEDILLRLGPS